VARQGGDDRIKRKFGRTDIPHLKKNFVDQVCEATGGPCTYAGRSMREAHDGMQVTASGDTAALAGVILPGQRPFS
jgi:hemoglobin